MTAYDRAKRALLAYLATIEHPTDDDTERAADLVRLAQLAYTRCYDRASRDTTASLTGHTWPDTHGDVQ